MATTFYKKDDNDNFIPVSEYDEELRDAMPYGSHLVVIRRGARTTIYNVNPDFAGVIAAFTYAKHEMADALIKASEGSPRVALTAEQLELWNKFKDSGYNLHYITYPSAYDMVKAGQSFLEKEVTKTLEHPAVKDAWDKFMMLYELTKQPEEIA